MLGIIGGGNMGTAILEGALSSKIVDPDHVWLSNRHIEKITPFGDKGVHITTDNLEVCCKSQVLLLAVKPQILPSVLDEIKDHVSGKCIVSIAAGISKKYLEEQLPGTHVICVMPNTPLMLGCGASAFTQQGDIPDDLYQFVYDVFHAAGQVAVLKSEGLNEIIPVNGSSPAFFFRMAKLMVQSAGRYGIDPETALSLTAKTMEGAALMLQSSGRTAEELERQVCSPGGTTLAALTAFDDLHFDQMIDEAFDRCIKRAYELGK